MNFRKLRSRNGHKAGGVVQAVEGDANVNRHQDGDLDRRKSQNGVSGLKRRSRLGSDSKSTANWRILVGYSVLLQ